MWVTWQVTLRELEAAIAHYRRLAATIAELDEGESLQVPDFDRTSPSLVPLRPLITIPGP